MVEVTRGGELLLRMEGGISISEDPNLRFNYEAADADALEVRAKDSDGTHFAGKSMPSES